MSSPIPERPARSHADHPLVSVSAKRSFLALVRLSAGTVRRGFYTRAFAVYAWLVALGHGLLFVYVVHRGGASVASGIVPAALTRLSWVALFVAAGTARDVAAEEREQGLVALSESQGVTPLARRAARVLATMYVVARSLGGPAVAFLLPAILLSPSFLGVLGGLGGLLLVAGYALCFGVCFGGLSRVAALLSARRGRALFSLFVFVPLMLGLVVPGMPDFAGVFSAIAEKVTLPFRTG